MLTANQLAKQLLACADGRLSAEEFEEWFDSNSWNIHQQPDQRLVDAVFHVEECFSAYYDKRADGMALLTAFREIANELEEISSPFLSAEHGMVPRAAEPSPCIFFPPPEPPEITFCFSVTLASRDYLEPAVPVDESVQGDQLVDQTRFELVLS